MCQLATRPVDFECPWCGPNGVHINRTLPIYLQLCDDCLPRPTVEPTPEPPPIPLAVTQLREILRQHVRDFNRAWAGCEHGKAIVENSLLGALASYGYQPEEELRAAVTEIEAEMAYANDREAQYREHRKRQGIEAA